MPFYLHVDASPLQLVIPVGGRTRPEMATEYSPIVRVGYVPTLRVVRAHPTDT